MIKYLLFFIVFLIAVVLICLKNNVTFSDVLDFIKNHKEYKTTATASEQFLYRALLKLGIPKNQIFRNVYIPRPDGKTTEIDILVVCKKGILIFEQKAYSGNIYGNGEQKRWVQYLGRTKNFFLSPYEQNRFHRECLENYLKTQNINKIQISTFITHSIDGKWHVKNLPADAHFLSRLREVKTIYNSLPDEKSMSTYFGPLCRLFAEKSRPTDGTREKHISEYGR